MFSKNPKRLKAISLGSDLENSFEAAILNVPESSMPAKLRTQKRVGANDVDPDVTFKPKKESKELEEIGCNEPRAGKRKQKELEENEELEETGVKNPGKYKTGREAGYDRDGDGVPNGADSDPNDGSKNESKIQTPEQENTLYESRFTPRNNRLFEKLVKQWTK